MRLAALALLGASISGCAHEFPARYDERALRADTERWPGAALVHYLSRPGARAEVCEPATFARVDESLVGPFVDGLVSNSVPPERWGACAERLVRWPPRSSARRWSTAWRAPCPASFNGRTSSACG